MQQETLIETREPVQRCEGIRIEVRGEPVPKGRARAAVVRGRDGQPVVKNGRVIIRNYTPDRTRTFEAYLRVAAQQAMGDRPPLTGPCKMHMGAVFVPPKSWSRKKRERALRGEIRPAKKPDWSNVAKTEDALKGIVFRDDCLVVDGSVSKVYGEIASLTIDVERLEGVEGA